MRTLIQGGWVVGYDGRGHELIPNGCVVFEDDRIVHVGARFDGPVDRRVDATGKLVSPGLINCHLHAATNAGQAVFLDGLKADYFGSNFVGYVAPRRGTTVPRAGDRADVAGTYGLGSALRAGATTIMDVGTMPGGPAAVTRLAGALGVRAYVGPALRSASDAHDGSRIVWEWVPAVGVAGLERALGINIALGTDTYPQDLVHEMRWAALMCRMADGSFRVGRPQDVFDAATLGGARHLGRDDLGRLAPGAKADIIVVDLRQLNYGAVHDPIKSLVECGTGRDVETVIVDGQTLVEGGRAARVDEEALLRDVQIEGERRWNAIPQWHWTARPLHHTVPPSHPVRRP